MRFLFVIDPLDALKGYKDSTVTMMRAAQARGHEVWCCEQPALHWLKGRVGALAQRLDLTDNDEDWYRAHAHETRELTAFDAVLMRKDPPFDMEYVYSTYLLECAEREGARVFNRPRAIRDHNEKLAIAEFGEFIAPTLVTRDMNLVGQFIDDQEDVVVKPLDGMGGSGVFRLHREDHNIGVILETITHYERRTVMAQRYLPEIKAGDKRILIIDGEPLPYALARIPKAGETRGNLAAGGRGVAQALSPRDREIAEAVAPKLAARGLLLVGLDVIGDYVTEVNVTSPTCFVEIAEQTGFDVAGMFVQALEKAAAGAAAPGAVAA